MPDHPGLTRRDWARLLAVLAPAAALPQSPAPQRVAQPMLHQALALLGLEFPPEQENMMLPAVNSRLAAYENLRSIEIPLDIEPAIRFFPALPGTMLPAGKPRFEPLKPPKPRTADDLPFRPLTELAALVRAKKVRPSELTRLYLDRLKQYGPQLNCVITLTEALAAEQAARADQEVRRGKYRGPLHGIPYGAKDLFATKGIPTTWGAEPYQTQVFDYDATVIDRLEKAGAILVAKLSMGALAQGGLWFGGMTKTPWNTEQSSSGSSAGSAAATAAGLVGFAIGTETLGSIVSPCTRCGVPGIRPTYGRVSRYGAMALSWTMDKIGPICRSVEGCMLVLRAIYGPDGRDLTVLPVPLNWRPKTPLRDLRIGYTKTEFDKTQGELKDLHAKALEDLRRAGAHFEAVDLPGIPTSALRHILTAEAAAQFDDLTRTGGVNKLRGQQPGDWPNTFRAARLIPAVEYLRAQRARTLLMRQMESLMANWDVLVTPFESASVAMTNMTGHPQVVVPCGFVEGMPQSILFTGRLYREDLPARVALAFEQATDWHKKRPPVGS